jgi:hypothetical protein
MIGITFCPFLVPTIISLVFLNSVCYLAVCKPVLVANLFNSLKFFCFDGIYPDSDATCHPFTTYFIGSGSSITFFPYA